MGPVTVSGWPVALMFGGPVLLSLLLAAWPRGNEPKKENNNESDSQT